MIPIIILSIENEDDREFMSRLYLDYRKRMFAKILGYVSDQTAAEDVLHDAVVKLIGKVELLRTLDEKRLACYVTETAKNAAKDFLRRQTPSVPLTKKEMDELPDLGELPEETAEEVAQAITDGLKTCFGIDTAAVILDEDNLSMYP